MRTTFHVSRFPFLLVLLLATAWAPSSQVDELAVVGQVTNGTSGGIVPADLCVTLHIFDETEEIATHTAALATDGTFRFDGLMPSEGENLVARVVYQDVNYYSDAGSFEVGQTELDLPITIYETTEDASSVLVTQLHSFISVVEQRLQILEYHLVSNTGDRTYVGVKDPRTGQRVTLAFTLPAGASGLRFDGLGLGERYLEWGGGFADTEPIPPGMATLEVSFDYELPYQEGMRVERAFDVPVTSVVFVIPDEGIAMEGKGVIPGETLDTQMGPASSYIAGPLAAGESLVFTLVAGPAGGQDGRVAEEQRSRRARETAIGLVTLAAAVVVAYLLWRLPVPGPLPAPARVLVESIAALDTDFEAGRVERETYHQELRALKRRLRVLLADQSND